MCILVGGGEDDFFLPPDRLLARLDTDFSRTFSFSAGASFSLLSFLPGETFLFSFPPFLPPLFSLPRLRLRLESELESLLLSELDSELELELELESRRFLLPRSLGFSLLCLGFFSLSSSLESLLLSLLFFSLLSSRVPFSGAAMFFR